MIVLRVAMIKHLMTLKMKRIMPNVKTKNDLCNELCRYMIIILLLLELHIVNQFLHNQIREKGGKEEK